MGIIAERFAEARSAQDFVTNDDYESGSMTGAGVMVTQRVALGLTTVWRCIDLLTSAVSQAPKDITIRVGGKSFAQFSKPSWLMSPNPADATYTVNDYFAQVAMSLLIDGNYFVRIVPDITNPIGLLVLPPSMVTVKDGPIYEIHNSSGQVTGRLGPDQMLHGTWLRPAGEVRGISPLEALRRSIGGAVAAEEFGGRFFGQGAALSFGVEVPGGMTKEQKADLRDSLRKRHEGLGNAHAIGVLTAGAKFVTGLAPTPEQAQMLATRKFSVEDLCRPYGVPPAMAGSSEPGAASFASTESYDTWFKERAVLPLASRIESQHDRLLSLPIGLQGTDATAQFRFNLDAIARTSLLTRYQAYESGVRGGFLKPDEARAKEDLPPVQGGDQLYMQQQMVPIGTQPADPAQGVAA